MGKYDFIKLGNLLYYFPLLEALSASCRGLIFMQD